MFKRFYFTCFSDRCVYYEKIRAVVIPAVNIETGGAVYQVPELWCDGGPPSVSEDPHHCIGPFNSEGELWVRINRRRLQRDMGAL